MFVLDTRASSFDPCTMEELELPLKLMKRWKKAHENGLRALKSERLNRNMLEEFVEELNVICDELVVWRENQRKKMDRNNLRSQVLDGISVLIEQFENEATTRSIMLQKLDNESLGTYVLTWKLNPFLESETFKKTKKHIELLKEVDEQTLFKTTKE